jgi:hypothetical protein
MGAEIDTVAGLLRRRPSVSASVVQFLYDAIRSAEIFQHDTPGIVEFFERNEATKARTTD